jgi:hypothetical protein
VDPLPDTLFFFSGSAGNRTRASGSVSAVIIIISLFHFILVNSYLITDFIAAKFVKHNREIRIIAVVVIVDLTTNICKIFLVLFVTYLRTKFDTRGSSASLTVAIKSMPMQNGLRVTMLLAFFL